MERAFGHSCGLHLRGVFFYYHLLWTFCYGKLSTATTPLLIRLDKWHCGGERESKEEVLHAYL